MRRNNTSRRSSGLADQPVELLEVRQLLSSTLQVGPSGQYHTIQSAVNAAHSSETILVSPGTYVEQVVVPANLNNLTIRSKNGPSSTIIQAPATLTASDAIIYDQAHGLQVTGLTIEGPSTGISAGVLVNGGSNAQITNDVIIHVHDAPMSGDESGYGIEVTGGGNASISFDSISDYQKNGILITGAGSSATICSVTVTGDGPTDVITQNGIVFDYGAGGSVSNSTVSANQTLLPFESGGILAYNSAQVSIFDNVVFKNDGDIILDGPSRTVTPHGQGLYNLGSSVIANETYGATYDGIDLFDGATGATIAGNYSHDNADDGLLIDATSTKNLIVFNVLIHNDRSNTGAWDLEDDTFGQSNTVQGDGGTANYYEFNIFGTTNTSLKSYA